MAKHLQKFSGYVVESIGYVVGQLSKNGRYCIIFEKTKFLPNCNKTSYLGIFHNNMKGFLIWINKR